MTVLGKFVKQPIEVEVYSISFVEDLATTDQIETAFQILAPQTTPAWDLVVQTVPYTALLTDAGRQLVATASVDGPANAPDGFTLLVANSNQMAAIDVAGFSVPARGAVVVRRAGNAWTREAWSNGVLVSSAGDQRVRTFLHRGLPGIKYKAQVTVSTAEGRTLQNEFVVLIKEA